MRYYNENPQVTMWREAARAWEMVAAEALKTARECNENCGAYHELVEKSKEQARESIGIAKMWAKTAEDVIEMARKFNALPWYKKLFYRFKL